MFLARRGGKVGPGEIEQLHEEKPNSGICTDIYIYTHIYTLYILFSGFHCCYDLKL